MNVRDDTCFQIDYSIRLEKMQSMLLSRIDRVVNFVQILLGAAVITESLPIISGLAIAALAAFSFVYQPGVKSVLALVQKQKYENLKAKLDILSDEELSKCFADLQESDSQAFGSLTHPAHMGEEIRRGHVPNFDLTLGERITSFLAGDLPRARTISRRDPPHDRLDASG